MNGRVQQEERKAGKTLIFGFDGTGNDPSDANAFMEDESISNVLKLHILMGGGLQSDRSDTRTPNGSLQVTHYYNGIGTREGGASVPLLGRLIRAVGGKINMAFAPTFGDARRILNEARADLRKAGCREGCLCSASAEAQPWPGSSPVRFSLATRNAPSRSSGGASGVPGRRSNVFV